MTPTSAKLDARLLPLLRAGDEAAWHELVRTLKPKLVGLLKRNLTQGNEHEAEELAMHAIERAHRALSRFRGESSLETWIFQIARNLALNRYWYHERRHRSQHLDLDHTPAGTARPLHEAIADMAPGVVELTELHEFNESLRSSLPRVPALQREALAMRIHGTSYEQIAASLGIDLGTVKSRIARGRDFLRAEMRLAS